MARLAAGRPHPRRREGVDPAQLADAVGAPDVARSDVEIQCLDDAVRASDVAGTRYDEHQMRALDNER